MMPTWTFQSPRNQRRAAAIAALLLRLDYDILCLEKAFDGGARDVLEASLGSRYPYRYGPANPACFPKTNGGVWVLSRVPLSDYREMVFDDSAGIEVFSRKGAIMLAGSVAGQPFQLIATHLQGDDGPAYRPDYQLVRNQQMTQIRTDLVERYGDPSVPLIVCGDFATPRRDEKDRARPSSGYLYMLQTFAPENGPDDRITLDDTLFRNDMATDDSGRTDELDYILLRPNGHAVLADWTRLVLRYPGWDGPDGRQDLSYRYAVGATFTFENPPPAKSN